MWIGDQSTAEFQQRNNEAHWWSWHPADGLLYVQYNGVTNSEKETLAAFAESLGRAIEEYPVGKLVIDMRNNNGGDTFLNEPLLRVVVTSGKVNAMGRLYVIIGRRTFSAAMNAVSYFGRYTSAIFVGARYGRTNNPTSVAPATAAQLKR